MKICRQNGLKTLQVLACIALECSAQWALDWVESGLSKLLSNGCVVQGFQRDASHKCPPRHSRQQTPCKFTNGYTINSRTFRERGWALSKKDTVHHPRPGTQQGAASSVGAPSQNLMNKQFCVSVVFIFRLILLLSSQCFIVLLFRFLGSLNCSHKLHLLRWHIPSAMLCQAVH